MMLKRKLVDALAPALISAALVASCGTDDPASVVAAGSIGRLTELTPDDIAGVGLEFPATGERFLYVRDAGQWRCINASRAVALDGALDGLVADLVSAGEMSREVADDRLEAYGFTSAAPRVTLFGTDLNAREDRDELIGFTLGSELEGRRSYVRIEGADPVHEIDSLPEQRFARDAGDRLPPMLDRRMLAGEWPDPTGGFTRAFLDFEDGRSMELARVGDPNTYNWQLRTPDAEPLPVLPYRIAGWQSFVYRAPYAGFAAPSEAPRVGLETVWLTITLIDPTDSIVLEVGTPVADRPLAVRNTKTGMLVLLAPENAALLVPTEGDLLDRSRANRWESWLGGGAVRR